MFFFKMPGKTDEHRTVGKISQEILGCIVFIKEDNV